MDSENRNFRPEHKPIYAWPDEEVQQLIDEHKITKTYYPAQFGSDLKQGDLMAIHGMTKTAAARISKLTIVPGTPETYDTDGLKIEYELVGD